MAERSINLNVTEGGIQRLRTKGGASEKSLYDLVNGYVTADQKIRSRPGTFRKANLPAGTKGLTAWQGKFHVFSHESVGGLPSNYELHVLEHPDRVDQNGDPIEIKRIHFAEPFMGALYVVCEFDVDPATDSDVDENIYHYWLQGEGDEWEASTEYAAGKLVSPTTPNGKYYKAVRLNAPNPSWTPNTPVSANDLVEPTTYNEYYYEAVTVAGDSPRTGETEPDWPTTTDDQIIEDVEGTSNTGSVQPPAPVISPEQAARYRRGYIP